jgi:hypothetical protein
MIYVLFLSYPLSNSIGLPKKKSQPRPSILIFIILFDDVPGSHSLHSYQITDGNVDDVRGGYHGLLHRIIRGSSRRD